MSPRRLLDLALTAAAALVVLSLVASSLLGQPVLLSYVEAGSMEPTLAPATGSSRFRRNSPGRSRRAT
jgi:hypothetical protein